MNELLLELDANLTVNAYGRNKIAMRECFEAQGTQELPPDHQFKKQQPCPHHSFRKFKPVKTRAVNHNTPTEKDLDL